jgi:AbrB family looped-hinge helix DNA binding protein
MLSMNKTRDASTVDWYRHGVAIWLHDSSIRWYSGAMRSTIDAAGRVVIPKEMRDRLGLGRGRPIEIRERDGRIEIEPTATAMSLVRRAGAVVAVPEESLPPLTDDVVRETLERVRR